MAWSVLIVDDHEGFRAGARALLEAEGFEVLGEAGDGESAVEQARSLRPQVVLLDVQLPGIDGFAVPNGLVAGRRRGLDCGRTGGETARLAHGPSIRGGAAGQPPGARVASPCDPPRYLRG